MWSIVLLEHTNFVILINFPAAVATIMIVMIIKVAVTAVFFIDFIA
jgi:hypothetical protein